MALTNQHAASKDDPCPRWLLDAVHEVVYRSADRAPRIAELMGCSESLLYAFATPPDNRSGRHWHLPAYRIVPLTHAAQNYALLDALEQQAGRTIPAPIARGTESLEQLSYRSLDRVGTYLTTIAAALADGRLSAEECRKVRPVLKGLRNTIDQLDLELSMADVEER